METEVDVQEWDWEVLVNDSPNHQNPNSQIELEREPSFSDGISLIHSDYFSLESHSHGHGPEPGPGPGLGLSESGLEMKENKSESESESETGSWLDPDQVQFPIKGINNNRGKRRREHNSSSSSSSQSDSDSPSTGGRSGSSDHDILSILQPHSDCTSHTHLAVGVEDEKEGDLQDTHQEDVNDENNNGVIEREEKIQACTENDNNKGSWWKVPFELLRYCLLRVRPVWSLSVAAAAIMGFVLVRRAWLVNKMKRKTQKGLRLNVTVDDKKVSQFMSRAARLNEAFSVVKRVPVIRPSLPAPGFAPWPVIGMR